MTVSRREAMRISGTAIAGMSVGRLASAFESGTVAPRQTRRVSAASGTRDTLSRQLARFVVTRA